VPGGEINLVGPGACLGREVFLTDSWALRLSRSFRYYKQWVTDHGSSGSASATKLGMTWGISAYF
jgi:hypothetical protein